MAQMVLAAAMEVLEQQEQTQCHRGVAYTGYHKGLAGTVAIVGVGIPEADQQIGTQTHAFPAHEQQEQVVTQHQYQHCLL